MPAVDAEFTRFEASGLTWTVESAFADAVRTQIAERIDDVETVPGASLVKRNMVRTVLRVPFEKRGDAGPRVIVKRYAVRGLLDWVKYTFKHSRARAEWEVARGLRAAGIPTAIPLAMAERRRGVLRDAALVTREIPDSVHLNAYVEAHLVGSPEADANRTALYDRLARAIRRMHAAGFVHNDLHGGNILVRGAPADPDFYIIDLHSVTRSAAPSAGARWFDLVKLLHSMLTCSTGAERVELCKSYEDEGGPSGTAVTRHLASGDLARALEPRLAALELRRVRSRTARSLERSSRFQISRVAGYRIHHLRQLDPDAILDAVDGHLDTLAGGGAQVLKNAVRSAVTRQVLVTPQGTRSVVVKEYRPGRLGARLKNLLRTSRPVAAWLAGNGLSVRRFDVAEPLVLVLKGRGPFLREAYMLMEDLGDRTRLDLVALESFAGALDRAARRRKSHLVARTARLLRRLHSTGVYHGDLKAVNLFVRSTPDGEDIAMADYDRVEFDRPVVTRRRIKNLAQLSASVAICITLGDRLRFFREYAAQQPRTRAAWKDWFAGVIRECERKIIVHMDPIE